MRIAVDLIWVKVGKVGGAESFIRNLLDGIKSCDSKNQYYLITTRDNEYSFRHYEADNIKILTADINSEPVAKRLFWQNVFFERFLKRNGIHYCFCPVYLKPIFKSKSITYITVIHDLQQLHYPEYFSKKRYYWTVNAWRRTIQTSKKVVAISNYVKNDIIENYNTNESKIDVIYDPIVIDNGEVEFSNVQHKYGIEKEEYFFALSAMLKHKNLDTLIEIIKRIVQEDVREVPRKLIVSGINGDAKDSIEKKIQDSNLGDYCVLTGFISNEERNTLYKNCYAFLFPSVFEGFGMPVIEGLMFGTRVITTRESCIPETSQGKAVYVNDPYDVREWLDTLIKAKELPKIKYEFSEYEKKNIAAKYIELFEKEFEGC